MGKKKKAEKKPRKPGKVTPRDAGLAFRNRFYLETSWILTLLFEKRSKSILKRIEGPLFRPGYSLEQCIKRIKFHHLAGKTPILEEYLDLALIEELRAWKNNRNLMLTDMIKVHVSEDRMERLASSGIELYRRWNRAVKRVREEMQNSGSHSVFVPAVKSHETGS